MTRYLCIRDGRQKDSYKTTEDGHDLIAEEKEMGSRAIVAAISQRLFQLEVFVLRWRAWDEALPTRIVV